MKEDNPSRDATSTAKRSTFKRKYPVATISFIIILYFSLNTFCYFCPVFIPKFPLNPFNWIPNEDYLALYILQIIVFISSFVWFLISFAKTITSKLSTIPKKYPWKPNTSPENPQEELEETALLLLNINSELNNHQKISVYPSKGDKSNTSTTDQESTVSSRSSSNSEIKIATIGSNDYITLYERDNNESIRFCTTCKMIKPDRCHHCKHCNECYWKMDHHCFWLDKCIAIDNYKYFILMLWYGCATPITSLVVFYGSLKELFWSKGICILTVAFYTIYVTSGIIAFAMVMLLWFHISLILSNFTTFEYLKLKKDESDVNYVWEYDRNILKEDCERKVISKYDVGKVNNFIQVFGENPITWFIPFEFNGDEENKGLSFNVSWENRYEVVSHI